MNIINLANKYLDTMNPSRLKFGINENVYLKSVDFERRKKSEGGYYPTLFFCTFAQCDPETGKETASMEFHFFGVSGDKKERIASSVLGNLYKWTEFLSMFYDANTIGQHFNPFSKFEINEEDPNLRENLTALLSDKRNAGVYDETFKQALKPLLTNIVASKALFRMKLTYYNGNLQIPIYLNQDKRLWVESLKVPLEESLLEITQNDIAQEAQAREPKKDTLPGAPGIAPAPPINPTGMVNGAAPVAQVNTQIPGQPHQPLYGSQNAAPMQQAAPMEVQQPAFQGLHQAGAQPSFTGGQPSGGQVQFPFAQGAAPAGVTQPMSHPLGEISVQ